MTIKIDEYLIRREKANRFYDTICKKSKEFPTQNIHLFIVEATPFDNEKFILYLSGSSVSVGPEDVDELSIRVIGEDGAREFAILKLEQEVFGDKIN